MRLFRLKSRFSKHRAAAPRLVLWQAKQCFIRENCGGAVALSGGGTTSSCSHWWSFFPEAKGSEELQNSAGLFIRWCSPIIYTTLLLPRPNWGPSGSWENSLKPHFDTCLIHFTLLQCYCNHLVFGLDLLWQNSACFSIYLVASRSRKWDALDEAALQGQKN